MRVCDRHPSRRAVDTIVVLRDDSHTDVCEECKTDVLMFLASVETEAPARRDKPHRNLAQAG